MKNKGRGIAAIAFLAIAALLFVGALVVAARFVSGSDGEKVSDAERASAQAVVDRCSPDYPLRITRAVKTGFIGKTWYEFDLTAVEDRKVTYRTSVASLAGFGDWRCLQFERTQLKIKRDGQTGESPGSRKLPEDIKAQYYFTTFDEDPAHPAPAPDFSTHDPYPYPREAILTLDRQTQNLGPDDGAMITAAIAAAERDGTVVTGVKYHMSDSTRNGQADWFDLETRALASPTLQRDLERAKAGASVPGVKYRRYNG